jgi:hypothetical protein
VLSDVSALMAETRLGVRTFSFSKTEIDKDSPLSAWVVEEVRRLDISVKDLVVVHTLQSSKEFSQIDGNFGDSQVAKVRSEVSVSEVWENSDDLVGFSKSGDKGANRGTLTKIMKKFKLVQNARGT